MSKLPETGFLRLKQILGDKKANPPIPAIIPIGKTSWWEGVKTGRYPKPIKLSERVTVWRLKDILSLCAPKRERFKMNDLYPEMVKWLCLLDEKELLELFHDMNDPSAVERIADCAYNFVENHAECK